MSVTGEFWRYSSEHLVPHALPLEKLSVADSLLIQNGAARALSAHVKRFSDSIAHDEVTLSQIPGFIAASLELIPETGLWWPRWEYRAESPIGERLGFQLRPAPELTETVALWSFDKPDPRTNPYVKGPDLALGLQLRRMANLHGADEAVLLNAEGYICDGALSSVMWWRAGVLYGPDDQTPWLPSVTRAQAFELAVQAGFEIAQEKAKPKDLEGCEVWNLSALQGIRGVTSWGDIPLAEPKLHHSFRKRLSLTFSPIKAQ